SAALNLSMAFDQPTKLDDYTPIDVAKGYHRLVLPYVQAIGALDLRRGEDGKRDPLNPHSGVYFANDFQVAFPDSQDIRVRPELRGYTPIAKRWPLALRGAFGILHPFGGELAKTPTPSFSTAPASAAMVDRARYIQVLQLRGFQSGGPTSNRGY